MPTLAVGMFCNAHKHAHGKRGHGTRSFNCHTVLAASPESGYHNTMAHLLIVDDEQSICWGLEKLAKELGHSTATAASAEEGLELARKKRPDVIVLNVRLPAMSGLEAMGHFQKLPAGDGPAAARVPVIVITAYGDMETAVEAVRNGAFDYLTKPFELDVAQRAIERALRQPAETPKPSGAPAPMSTSIAAVCRSSSSSWSRA